MYGFQQKIIHDKKKKREELRYHRIVGTKQRIKRKCEKKNKKNKTQIKSAFDEPLVDLTWPREKSVSLKTEENKKTQC